MGYAFFAAKSNAQIERHIRALAMTAELIVITHHARARMKARRIDEKQLLDILRQGVIERPPRRNIEKRSLECRMQRYLAGRECAAIVALSDENPNLLIVTVMEIDK